MNLIIRVVYLQPQSDVIMGGTGENGTTFIHDMYVSLALYNACAGVRSICTNAGVFPSVYAVPFCI